MANKEFSKIVKTIRSNYNLTMQDLANEMGVTKSAINMWENKGVVPREDILLRFSQKYQISIDKMLGNNYDPIDNPTGKLGYIQRNLEKLDEKQLIKAEQMLKVVFEDIFDDDDMEDDDDL